MGEKKGKWGEEKEKVGRGGGGGRCRHWGNSERKKGSSLGVSWEKVEEEKENQILSGKESVTDKWKCNGH